MLTVPEMAVIDTGSKKLVYVEREPGQFDGVEVEVGPVADGFYPVLKGLRSGDRVAAAGAFLIDAETRLNPGAVRLTSAQAAGHRASPNRRRPWYRVNRSQQRNRPSRQPRRRLRGRRRQDRPNALQPRRPTR